MLDFFRNHKRLMMALLILFILPGLGFVGVQGFRGFFGNGDRVAKVNNYTITNFEFENAWRNTVAQARQQQGSQFNKAQFDTPEQRSDVLNTLLEQHSLLQEISRLHLGVPDAVVKANLLSDPVIASLRKPDGTFDAERYTQLLAAQGLTPQDYENQVRTNLVMRQIPMNIFESAFLPRANLEKILALVGQKRVVQVLQIKPQQFLSKVNVSHQQIADYYQKHQKEFVQKASAEIQYVVFSPNTLAQTIVPTQAELKAYYQSHLKEFQSPKEVRVSHIFIAVPQQANAAVVEKAKEKADRILSEVQKQPQNFAQFAKRDSEDEPSAVRGGDLGFISPGMLAGGPAFDQAAFSLKEGQISQVIRSDLGFHILKVTAIKPVITKPFESVKNQITQEYIQAKATELFNQGSDDFSSIVYEKSKSLQPVADKFHLKIQTAKVNSTEQTAAVNPLLNHEALLSAIFSDDSVKRQYNTKAIDVGNNQLVSARAISVQPARLLSLDEATAQIKQKIALNEATQLALKAGQEQLLQRQKDLSISGFSSPQVVTRMQANQLPNQLGQLIFQANAKKLPVYVGASLGDLGYVIYRINAVQPAPALSSEQLDGISQQLTSQQAQAELQAYLNSLMARSKIKRYGDLKALTEQAGE